MSKIDYTAAGAALSEQHDASPKTQIVKHRDYLEARMPQLAKWVRDGVKPEALVRFLLLDMQQVPKLAACTRESLYIALLACAQTGLEPGSLRGECYVIPYGSQATFVVGWRGLIKQVKRSGEIIKITPNVVHAADHFEIDLGAETISHRPALGDRGDVIGAYAVAKHKSGELELEWMDRVDLDKRKRLATSRGLSPAWKDWEHEMMRKAPVRRLCKRLPLGADYFAGRELDVAAETGRSQADVIEALTESTPAAPTAPEPNTQEIPDADDR